MAKADDLVRRSLNLPAKIIGAKLSQRAVGLPFLFKIRSHHAEVERETGAQLVFKLHAFHNVAFDDDLDSTFSQRAGNETVCLH